MKKKKKSLIIGLCTFTDLRTVLEKLNITNRLKYGLMFHKREKVVWLIGNIISRIKNIV